MSGLLGVYQVSRCYGGPEEGGWWYDYFEWVKSISYNNEDERAQLLEDLKREYTPQRDPDAYKRLGGDETVSSSNPEGYIPAGWSDGVQYRFMLEETVGQWQTRETPRYE